MVLWVESSPRIGRFEQPTVANSAQARVPVLLEVHRASTLLYRLRMNRDSRDLRESFFHAGFEFGDDVVDLRDREPAIHGAMAGGEDFVLHLADVNFVAVDQLVKFAGKRVDVGFDGAGEAGHISALAVD